MPCGHLRRAVADLGCGTCTLSVLLAEAGHVVHGLDYSPRMLELAARKAAGLPQVTLLEGDAYEPPLAAGQWDVVLSRHVLWAMPEPAVALERWLRLLARGGRLVLVEGRWGNGAGLSAEQALALVEATGRPAELRRLTEARFWGRAVEDDRYLLVSPDPAGSAETA